MQAVVAELLPLVPSARREQALRFRHLHGQYCCLRSWQLLYSLLIEHAFIPSSLPLSDLTFTLNPHGKPELALSHLTSHSAAVSHLTSHGAAVSHPASNIHFSISHTKTALAVAIDHSPIGIDIESLASASRIADRHFLSRTMSPDEQSAIAAAPNPCLAFTELWTRKEALVKARGTGLTDLDSLPSLLDDTAPFTLLTLPSATCAPISNASVCSAPLGSPVPSSSFAPEFACTIAYIP